MHICKLIAPALSNFRLVLIAGTVLLLSAAPAAPEVAGSDRATLVQRAVPSGLLGRVRSEDERLRSLQIVDQEARRLTHLVENILQFSRAEREAIRLAPVPSELGSQVREAIEAFAPVARARHVSVQTAIEPDIVCVVDPGALRQILLNLLDNAVKYGPLGQTVTITVRRVGERARIIVDQITGVRRSPQ